MLPSYRGYAHWGTSNHWASLQNLEWGTNQFFYKFLSSLIVITNCTLTLCGVGSPYFLSTNAAAMNATLVVMSIALLLYDIFHFALWLIKLRLGINMDVDYCFFPLYTSAPMALLVRGAIWKHPYSLPY